MNRWLDLDGVANMRDVGGIPTADGGTIQPRRLIRSDNLQDLSEADVRRLIEIVCVTDIVDLRSHREVHVTGEGPLRATALRHHHHSFFPDPTPKAPAPEFLAAPHHDSTPRDDSTPGDAAATSEAPSDGDVGRDPAPAEPEQDAAPAPTMPREPRGPLDEGYWSQHYRGYLTTRPDSVAAALSVVATAAGATVVHCAAGKDRTGTVVGLALSVAGVPHDAIVEDYALSGERIDRILERLSGRPPYKLAGGPEERERQIPRAASMELLLGIVDEEYGGAAGWLRAQGWTDAEIETLRLKLIRP